MSVLAPMPYAQQQQTTRQCARVALLLLQYGAQSSIVVGLTRRLGLALGMSTVECALSLNSVTLTTIVDNRCITTVRANDMQAVNAYILIQIQKLILLLESSPKGKDALLTLATLELDRLNKDMHPPMFMAAMVGMSASTFALINGAGVISSALVFIAAFVGVHLRTRLMRIHLNGFVSNILVAFLVSSLASLAHFWRLDEPDVVMAAAILLLIPSFPIINSWFDALKGYIIMSQARWVYASMLSAAACVGIVSTIVLFDISGWGLNL